VSYPTFAAKTYQSLDHISDGRLAVHFARVAKRDAAKTERRFPAADALAIEKDLERPHRSGVCGVRTVVRRSSGCLVLDD
jgi:hypothetical protein